MFSIAEPHGTWGQAVADLGGHLHVPARDCIHRPPDACRVCCPHDDTDPSVDITAVRAAAPPTPPAVPVEDEPVSSDWRDDDRARARVLVYCLVAALFATAAICASAWTLAGGAT